MNFISGITNAKRWRANRLSPIAALSLSLCFASCEPIFDDQSDCASGLSLAFIYDYHMEPGANAFPTNVDCVDLLVFDPDGNYITKFTETSAQLQNEGYRMQLPLDPGNYHLVAYGGLACNNPTFQITPEMTAMPSRASHKNDIRVTLPVDENGVSAKQLHDVEARTGGLFYGTLDISIADDEYTRGSFREETMPTMKNTNHIQVILQELNSPYTIDYNDYNFKIVDDNFVLDGHNNAVNVVTADYQPIYKPFAGENRVMGYVEPKDRNGEAVEEDESRPVQVGCVEFSTSRLFADHASTARLVVTSAVEKDSQGNDKEIINIPLITYLAATRGFGDSWIKSDQEYLDRQSRWTLMFFLQRNSWVKAQVAVNWWTVRINNVEL